METQAALIRANGTVELHTVSAVQLYLAVVIHPGNTENNGTVCGGQPLQQRLPAVLCFIAFDHGAQRFQNFLHGLLKFRLIGILVDHTLLDLVNIAHKGHLFPRMS